VKSQQDADRSDSGPILLGLFTTNVESPLLSLKGRLTGMVQLLAEAPALESLVFLSKVKEVQSVCMAGGGPSDLEGDTKKYCHLVEAIIHLRETCKELRDCRTRADQPGCKAKTLTLNTCVMDVESLCAKSDTFSAPFLQPAETIYAFARKILRGEGGASAMVDILKAAGRELFDQERAMVDKLRTDLIAVNGGHPEEGCGWADDLAPTANKEAIGKTFNLTLKKSQGVEIDRRENLFSEACELAVHW
jgi:hypothetical protein